MKQKILSIVKRYQEHIAAGTNTACIAIETGIEPKAALKILKELESEGKIERITRPSLKGNPVTWIIKRKDDMTKMGRPLKGNDNRKLVSIRLAPDEKELLVKHFGGVQAAVDSILDKLKKKK